jgi:hypothetical protein
MELFMTKKAIPLLFLLCLFSFTAQASCTYLNIPNGSPVGLRIQSRDNFDTHFRYGSYSQCWGGHGLFWVDFATSFDSGHKTLFSSGVRYSRAIGTWMNVDGHGYLKVNLSELPAATKFAKWQIHLINYRADGTIKDEQKYHCRNNGVVIRRSVDCFSW